MLDANTGQNALAQVKAFDAAVGLTGLVVTKLDGSAKGGVVAAIAKQHPVPLKFIGVGEGAGRPAALRRARVRRRAAAGRRSKARQPRRSGHGRQFGAAPVAARRNRLSRPHPVW